MPFLNTNGVEINQPSGCDEGATLGSPSHTVQFSAAHLFACPVYMGAAEKHCALNAPNDVPLCLGATFKPCCGAILKVFGKSTEQLILAWVGSQRRDLHASI